jgi:flagellar FliL protein
MAGKTLVLFIILPAVLVLGGGGAAAMMLLGGGAPAAAAESAWRGRRRSRRAQAEEGHGEAKAEDHGRRYAAAAGEHGAERRALRPARPAMSAMLSNVHGDDPCYYAMPKLIVNLAGTEGQRSPYMELELTLESSSSATFKRVPELMPRLKDQLNSFLRELRVEDLNGSTGTWRLRRELLNRFNTVMDPKKVDAVLIESMLIQ